MLHQDLEFWVRDERFRWDDRPKSIAVAMVSRSNTRVQRTLVPTNGLSRNGQPWTIRIGRRAKRRWDEDRPRWRFTTSQKPDSGLGYIS